MLRPKEFLHYRTAVDLKAVLPEAFENPGGHILVHFGAVDQSCDVFWNHQKAGHHEGGYLSFTIQMLLIIREGNRKESMEECGIRRRAASGRLYGWSTYRIAILRNS